MLAKSRSKIESSRQEALTSVREQAWQALASTGEAKLYGQAWITGEELGIPPAV
jgi:hypothetical protein